MSVRASNLAVNGVLLLDKPFGLSSNAALTRVKRSYGSAKAGHTGTLDPFATGLLPVCFGEATKFAGYLLDADKAYEATIHLGVMTATGDAEGEVLARNPVRAGLHEVREILGRFRGRQRQTPPMHSALKHRGRPLYALARSGVMVDREPREITVHRLELVSMEADRVRVRVRCSKGTYVRVLAQDIGQALGCGASLSALRRTGIGVLGIEQAKPLAAVEAADRAELQRWLLPADCLVAGLPRVDLGPIDARWLLQGRAVPAPAGFEPGRVRLYGPGVGFVGVGEVLGSGDLVARRMMAAGAAEAPGFA